LFWQVACEFIAASRKLALQGFTAEMAWTQLAQFIDYWPLTLPSHAILDRARTLHLESKWAWWDALIAATAIESGVKRLYSEDLPGRSPPEGLEIINPFA